MITKDKTNITPNLIPSKYPFSGLFLLAKELTMKNDMAVKIIPSLLIIFELMPVKLIKEVIIALPIIKRQNNPKYLIYSNTLYIKSP